MTKINRREALGVGISSGSWFALANFAQARTGPTVDYKEPAFAAERWLQTQAIKTSTGLIWRHHPEMSDQDAEQYMLNHFYTGSLGVIAFYLELYASTGDRKYLETAMAGADAIVADAGSAAAVSNYPGLYVGNAGAAFVLHKTALASGEARYKEAAQTYLQKIIDASIDSGRQISWRVSDEYPEWTFIDIVAGAAGVILTLIELGDALNIKDWRLQAANYGDGLISHAYRSDYGLDWPLDPGSERIMPNFSHGTAGNAFALARLYEATGEERFLEAAVAGAEHLLAIADCNDTGCLIHHSAPKGVDRYYLAWCHGPAGSSRFFHVMHRITGRPEFERMIYAGAEAILASGVPEKETSGYWNNISQCCGAAGIGEFFLALHAHTREHRYLDYAENRIASHLMNWAVKENDASRWPQAENRVSPDEIYAQTGWMQGAAGVGAFFLHLDARKAGRKNGFVLPDNPWPV